MKLSQRRDSEGHIVFDAHNAEGINTGYIRVKIRMDPHLGPLYYFIDEMYVRPEFRGHGVARGLMTYCLRSLLTYDIYLCVADYEKEEYPAENGADENTLFRFYQSFGFRGTLDSMRRAAQ